MIYNLLNVSDLNYEDIINILQFKNTEKVLKNKNIGLLFEKYSTRTRLSFNVAINDLGGNVIDIKFQDLNISRSETFEDTFKAMNCYLDGLVYRTSDHQDLIKASKSFDKPIINALSDISHPCQAISDLYTLYKRFNSLNLKILWIGDMNNVCFSFYELVKKVEDLELIICCPKSISLSNKWDLKKNINIINNISELNLNEFDCVMTDVFISMNDDDSENKKKELIEYQVNKELMSKTKSECIFMHCLPANIGQEVTEEVINGSQSIVWEQARNRMLSQKNILSLIPWR
ncbi:ornithine carbamoyltransferase [Alphaproteobacteria bacterium]|nr:ornithine carbamoyltransferase [Alphaproteobacteria bacterium]